MWSPQFCRNQKLRRYCLLLDNLQPLVYVGEPSRTYSLAAKQLDIQLRTGTHTDGMLPTSNYCLLHTLARQAQLSKFYCCWADCHCHMRSLPTFGNFGCFSLLSKQPVARGQYKWSCCGQLGKCKFVKVHTHTQPASVFEKAAAKLSFHNKRTKPVMED